MHVLVTADTIGGVWIYVRELVTGLARRGVRVTLVSFGEIPTPQQMEWLEGLRGVDFHPTAFRLEWMHEAEEDIRSSSELLMSLIDEVRPDLLHLNQFCYGALPTSLPKLVVAHSDVLSWWESVNGSAPPDGDWSRWYRATVAAGLAGATAVVAPTRWMLQSVERLYGAQANRFVIYNGRNPALFNPHCAKQDVVLSVGRIWDAGKQVNLLTEFKPEMPVCIVGQQQHADERLRAREATQPDSASTDSAPVGDSDEPGIEFRGPQSEGQLRHLYSQAGIYAATSRYEPFGLAPLEAAFSRCAVIANDIPSFRELWGHTAYYFQQNDSASLAQAIARLHGDRTLRLTYANLAYNRARQRFTADRMVDEYLGLYKSMVPAGTAAA
jgi:glycosyltransferase involved in cell wall biosynthesis